MGVNGIDVSAHQETIDWKKVKNAKIDFAMIRAGYGKNNIDSYCKKNVEGCINNKIPFGFYWFSYALNKDMARKEADYVCDIADKYKPITYPIAYDWEYDSDTWAKKQNVNITNKDRAAFAETFLNRVKERGYKPMLYTNIDYLSKGFDVLYNKYEIWLAQWNVSKPSKTCAIWQTGERGKVNGVSGYVDTNISYKNYSGNTDKKEETAKTDSELKNITNVIINRYTNVARDIIKGKYGNGSTRVKKLKEGGYDYDVAQMFVNYLINQ